MRAPAAAVVLFSLLLAGCTGPSTPSESAQPAAPLLLAEPVRVTGNFWTREPAIEQHPDGTLFVAGYPGTFPEGAAPPVGLPGDLGIVNPFRAYDLATTPPGLWSSRDGGATWSLVDVGQPRDGALGNSDVDLAVSPDGTLHFISMTFSSIGHSIAVGVSADVGATWAWQLLSGQPLADRPWIEAAPDGTVHAVWNDGTVVHHAASADRGQSWQEGPPVHMPGGDGNLAISPEGALAVRIIPSSGSGYTKHEGQDGVAVSEDGGASWAFHPLPGRRSYQAVPEFFTGQSTDFYRWADPAVFDATGTLYAAWGEEGTDALMLATSADLGATWDVATVWRTGDGTLPIYPQLRAHPDEAGVLAVSWFTRPAEGEVRAHVARVEDAAGPAPRLRQAWFVPDTGGDTGGEYFQVAFLADGGLGFATPVQNGEEFGFEFRTARTP